LGWRPREGEDENTRLLRQSLVPNVALEADEKQLVSQASELARNWLSDHKAVPPELVGSVLRVAASHGDREFFDRLHEAAKNEKDQRTREIMIGALGAFGDPALAQAGLNLLLTNDFDSREAFYALLFGPMEYRATRTLPFEFVRGHIDELLAKLPREVGGDFAAALPETGKAFCDAQHRAEVESFFGERVKSFTGGPRNLANTLETIDECIAKKKALGPDLVEFLRARSQ
jgi:alanyl aminopeptidase